MKGKGVALSEELFFEHVYRQFVEVKSHVGDHALVLFLYSLVGGSGGVDWMDVKRVFAQSDRHRN